MKIIAITPRNKKDTLTSFIMDGLNDLDIEVIATDSGNNVKETYSNEEVIKHSKDADYIFAFWGKHSEHKFKIPTYFGHQKSPKFYLLDEINRPEITAYIDGSEWTSTGFLDNEIAEDKSMKSQDVEAIADVNRIKGEPWIDKDMYNKCSWYFKRIVLPEDLKQDKIIPCYIGAFNSFTQQHWLEHEKEIDLYCSFGGNAGHLTTGLRKPVYEYCNSLKGYNSVIGEKLKFKDYINTISKSYIAISAWGAGNCCQRMWEILANKTCCFIQKPILEYPNKLVDGESCVYYETLEEFKEKLNYYLDNKEECIRIGKNGYEHIKKYHTGLARVKYMLNVMKGKKWRNALSDK